MFSFALSVMWYALRIEGFGKATWLVSFTLLTYTCSVPVCKHLGASKISPILLSHMRPPISSYPLPPLSCLLAADPTHYAPTSISSLPHRSHVWKESAGASELSATDGSFLTGSGRAKPWRGGIRLQRKEGEVKGQILVRSSNASRIIQYYARPSGITPDHPVDSAIERELLCSCVNHDSQSLLILKNITCGKP
jgi:hypothetical protein